MSRNMKIFLGILAVLGICCVIGIGVVALGGGILANQFSQGMGDSEQAADTGQKIVPYTVPAGYQEEGSISIFGMDMVFISPSGSGNSNGMIFMVSRFGIPGADPDSMKTQMQQSFNQQFQSGSGVTLEQVEQRDITIQGELTTLDISEGEDDNGNGYRQATALFDSKGAPAMVMIAGPIDSWDESAVSGFLRSIE